MAVKEIENEWGWKSYHVGFRTPTSAIPGDLLARFKPNDLAFLRDPKRRFKALIEGCEHAMLKQWLQAEATKGLCRMEVHIGPGGGADVVIRFGDAEDAGSGITLPNGDPRGLVHEILVPIYASIGGTMHCDFAGTASGDLESPPHTPFSNMGWIEESPSIDPNACFGFVTEPDGNTIGWHPSGQGVYCNHGELEWMGDLDVVVDVYFEMLL